MTAKAETIAQPPNILTQKRILMYWLPLAASWLLMAFEWPFLTGVMARLNEPKTMIAAFGIVSAISLVIESPVISLLPTSTALARSRQSYLTLRRFTIHLMIGTTILHVVMGWTPLFDLIIIDLMGIPEILHEPTRLGMQIMLFWSAAIAWRRFTQGILIRQGLTRYVGIGTIVRLVSSIITATLFALFSDFPGIAVGALALEVGVISEAIFVHSIARKTISEKYTFDSNPDEPDLSYRNLVKFIWPLAASNLIFLAARPLVSAALARGLNPKDDLAAWPVLGGLLFITRSPAIALPEVVIALHDDNKPNKPFSTFTFRIGLLLTGVMVLFSFTGLSHFYFENLIGVSSHIAGIAMTGVIYALILPLVTGWLSYFRGIFTAEKRTFQITLAMVVELMVMVVILAVGVWLKVPGIPLAATTLTVAAGADTLYLLVASRWKKKLD
jgi:Na+-driven multidrug efflux pump